MRVFLIEFFLLSMLSFIPLSRADIIPDKIGREYLQKSVEKFNSDDCEQYSNLYPNKEALSFLSSNIPMFDCPDEMLKEVYYFRWWTYRKHIKNVDGLYLITEFLPKVPWSDKNNAIVCPAALHIREGRWLKNKKIVSDYVKYWCFKSDAPRSYSAWHADSALNFYKVNPDKKLLEETYPTLKKFVSEWEKSNKDKADFLFWSDDGRDGMECSASGYLFGTSAYRATINSYMYAEYAALSEIAKILGNKSDSSLFSKKAADLKKLINEVLWDDCAKFYKVRSRNKKNFLEISPVRELHGYTPWYFNIAPEEYGVAWSQICDEHAFKAPFGLTSAERRSPHFKILYSGHECQWNGPVWPYATSITLTAFANYLNDYKNHCVTKNDYYEALKTYAYSHTRVREDLKKVFWIDENIDPFTGAWISRERLKQWKDGTWYAPKGGVERGKDYNHSNFADIIINGLIGVKPQLDGTVKISPLVPENWKFFCLDNLYINGKNICILWDCDSSRYNRGKGFFVFVNSRLVAKSDKIETIVFTVE